MRYEVLNQRDGGTLGVYEAQSVAQALGLAKVAWIEAGKPSVRVRSLETIDLMLWHQRGIDCHHANNLPIDHDGRPLGELHEDRVTHDIERMYEEELAELPEPHRTKALQVASWSYQGAHEDHGGTVVGDHPSHVPPEPSPFARAA